MTTLAEVRASHPEYDDLSDEALAASLHKKFYSDMNEADFYKKISFDPVAASMDARVASEGVPNAATRVWNKGLPFGSYLDEVGAGISAARNALGFDGMPYDEALALERARDRAAEKQFSGGTGVGLKLASGLAIAPFLPLAKGASVLGNIAKGAGAGAGYGAVYGFGMGEGGARNRAESAQQDAGIGAVLGGALPAAGAAIKSTSQAVSQALPQVRARLPQAITRQGPDQIADDVLASRIARSGQTPTGIRRDLDAGQNAVRFGANSQGQLPETISDTSDTLQRLAGSVYRQGGRGAETIKDFLETRQRGADNPYSRFAGSDRGQRGRIEENLSRALQIFRAPTARRTEQSIISKQKAEGNRLYGLAYNKPDDFDLEPAIDAFGLVRMQYTGPFRSKLEAAASLFDAPFRMSTSKPNYFDFDVRRFDSAKKQLDDMIESAKRGGENNLARELTQFKNSLLERVHAPDASGAPTKNVIYQEAREAWGSAAERREAIDLGRQALRDGSEISVEQFRALTPGQKILFRQGFLESARGNLGRGKPGNDATALFQQGRVADLLSEVIENTPSKSAKFADRSGRFGDVIQREGRMGSTRTKVLGNSMTEQRRMDDAEFAADALSRIMTGFRGVTNMGLEVVGAALQKATGYRQDVAESLAKRLVEADPAKQRLILASIRKTLGPSRFGTLADNLSNIGPSMVPAASSEASHERPSMAPPNQSDRNGLMIHPGRLALDYAIPAAKGVGSAVNQMLKLPERAWNLSKEAGARGGFDKLPPSEVGRIAFEVGAVPMLGATAAPTNALLAGGPLKEMAARPALSAAVGGAAGAGSDLYGYMSDGDTKPDMTAFGVLAGVAPAAVARTARLGKTSIDSARSSLESGVNAALKDTSGIGTAGQTLGAVPEMVARRGPLKRTNYWGETEVYPDAKMWSVAAQRGKSPDEVLSIRDDLHASYMRLVDAERSAHVVPRKGVRGGEINKDLEVLVRRAEWEKLSDGAVSKRTKYWLQKFGLSKEDIASIDLLGDEWTTTRRIGSALRKIK